MPLSKLKSNPKLNNKYQTTYSFEAIGTSWSIVISQKMSDLLYKKLITMIDQRIELFDRHYSRFRKDSLVSSMAQTKGEYILPNDGKPMFDFYKELYDITDGEMTPLIGQLLSDYGYDREYSLIQKDLKPTPSWTTALDYKFPKLLIKKPVLIDVGALGKGYIVDIISDLIENSGIKKFSINAGGDILNRNVLGRLNKIGLEHPIELDQVIGVAEITNGSICGSAGNRRRWGNIHHIVSPSSQSSPDEILASWVVADKALLADGLSTALFFIEAPKLQQKYKFEYAIVRKDLSLERSENFPAEFFTLQRGEFK
jgi:thiamine biosynthesis lipoprotein